MAIRSFRPLLSHAAALTLVAGCVASPVSNDGISLVNRAPISTTGASQQLREATGSALIEGKAKGPAGLVGANINGADLVASHGGRLVAGNTSRFVAAGAAPEAAVRYGTLALAEEPIVNAIVYLTDPEERFYANNGQPITATTDKSGLYKFVKGLPADQVVIVNVMLSDNRREVGFTVAKAGKNVINVSLATTYVTEFLRERAARTGKKMAAFDLAKLSELTKLTEAAISAGELAVPDLAIGKIAEMNQAYALAVGLNQQGLGDAWAAMLGERVLAVTTVAGNGESGFGGDGKEAVKAQLYKPKSVARDAAGNLYVADEGNHAVRKIATNGTISTFAGLGRPEFSGDDGPASAAGLWWPRTVVAGKDALFIGDTLNMRIRKVDLSTGVITTFAGDPDQANGAFLNDFDGDGDDAVDAKLAGVRGMALGASGKLFFADTWDNDGGSWHHLRRIGTDGVIDSLVGVDGSHGFNGDGKPGRETQINYVNQVAVDADENVYFADARNHRVRKVDAATGRVSTVAGTGNDGTAGDGGKATAAELSSPYGVALDAKKRLYISERGSRRIRVVLEDGTIRTIAGGGTFSGDGEAAAVALTEPHDLLIEPDGNLLFADSRAAKVRRIWLKWGF